ncbi:glycosyltransferase family 4 protein [Pseudanabaena sp. PCC 6802]|uniref:glycosyltransferase family 4 protein n=1 Tax=Pseudanabaena sp. PCC 6802 TaxID=118173 RepID=UPI000344D5D4|nr:glycosyltransferase family 4 protein [Pseudanabaena sp. PCC 6802]
MNLKDKHILVVSSVYPLTVDGNHGAFVRESILRLQSTGAKFAVFAPAYEGCTDRILDSIPIYRFRYCLKPFENLVRDGAPTKLQKQPLYLIVAALYILLGTVQLFWLCLRRKPDLLQIHWPFPHGLMALPSMKLLGIPAVFSCHGAELLLSNKFKFVSRVLAWLFPMAKGITANSSFTYKLIRKIFTGSVQIIPYGQTIEAKPVKHRSFHDPDDPARLLFVGRLDERKGLKYLLDALPLVLAERKICLRIVGKGFLEAELRSQSRELGLDRLVSFLGFVSKEELADEYANCDIFVLPAIVDSKGDTEGLGVVLIEALAHAKPVVATNVGGIPDVIVSGKTGQLVPEKDVRSLAQAILNVLAKPEIFTEMGLKGLEDIQTRFSWERIVPMWERVFMDALSDTGIVEFRTTDDRVDSAAEFPELEAKGFARK